MSIIQYACIGGVVGFACGLMPAIVAYSRGKQNLVETSLVGCMIAGAILGLIAAIPTAIGFTIVALMNPQPTNVS